MMRVRARRDAALLCVCWLLPALCFAGQQTASGTTATPTSVPSTAGQTLLNALTDTTVVTSAAKTADTLATALSGLNIRRASIQETNDSLHRAVRRTLVNRAGADPQTGSSNQTEDHSQATFLVDEKGGVNAHARVSIPFMGDPNSSLQLTVTAPVTQHNATFATGAGLGKNVSFEGAFKYTLFTKEIKYPAGGGERVNLSSLSAGERSAAAQRIAGTRLGELSQRLYAPNARAPRDYVEIAAAIPATLSTLRRLAEATGLGPVIATLIAADAPEYGKLLSSRSLVGSEARFLAAYAQMPDLLKVDWAGHFSIGYLNQRTTLDYLTDAYEKKSFDRTATGIAGAFGVSRVGTWKFKKKEGDTEEPKAFTAPMFYGGISVKSIGSVNAGDARNICTDLTATASECFKLPVGEPVFDASATQTTAEVRLWARNQSVGVHPSYTWATHADKTDQIAELRFYFLHQVTDIDNPDLKFGADLAGGVAFGFKRGVPDGKGKSVTVFLTKTFGLPD